jgi:uncharacterized protein YpuA (DUF1002 family)
VKCLTKCFVVVVDYGECVICAELNGRVGVHNRSVHTEVRSIKSVYSCEVVTPEDARKLQDALMSNVNCGERQVQIIMMNQLSDERAPPSLNQ